MSDARRERIGRIIAAVVRQAVQDAGADGIVLQDPDSPEGALVRAWCEPVVAVRREPHAGGGLLAHPANKSALLLAPMPPATLLPLGDVYASEVAELAGAWSAPAPVRALVAGAGDVASVDAALRRWSEGREPIERAVRGLRDDVAAALASALRAGRFGRLRCGLVPKLGGRTLGIDQWD